jgi:2-dehydro-3-deoxyphosphogluconate aldolase/(4S)-4-hydroxy-2-oxoglutarate aldolase
MSKKPSQVPFHLPPFARQEAFHPENYNAYLQLSNVARVGGSWLVPADAVKTKDWNKVTELAKQAIYNVIPV